VRSDEWLTVSVLSLMIFAGVAAISVIVRRSHRILSFRVFAVASYLIVNLAAGIAHVLDRSRIRRGFFDAMVALEPGQLFKTSLIAALGLAAISVGVIRGLPQSDQPTPLEKKWLVPKERALLAPVVAVLIPVSLWSLLKIQAYASTLETTRIITVSGGMARYVFISSWLVPAICFTAIWIVNRPMVNEKLLTPLVLFVGVIAIVASGQWAGGRSSAFYSSLPLIMVLAAGIRKMRGPAIAFGVAISFILTMVAIRQNDLRQSKSAFGSTGLSDWVDWELGRFSMLGFSVQTVDRYGMLFGETFINSVFQPISGLSRLLGLELPQFIARSSMEVAAGQLLNSSTAIYIVPGLSAELFLNFGAVGVLFGYFTLGRLCGWIDDRSIKCSSPLTQLGWAYAGMLVFKSIAYGVGQIFSGLLFTGLPVLIVAYTSFLIRGQRVGTGTNLLADRQRFLPEGRQDQPGANATAPTATASIAKPISRQGADRPMRSD